MVFECIIAGLVVVIFILLLFKGLNINITVSVEQKIPEVPVELKDLYDTEGNLVNKDEKKVDFNDALRDIYNFMTDSEE